MSPEPRAAEAPRAAESACEARASGAALQAQRAGPAHTCAPPKAIRTAKRTAKLCLRIARIAPGAMRAAGCSRPGQVRRRRALEWQKSERPPRTHLSRALGAAVPTPPTEKFAASHALHPRRRFPCFVPSQARGRHRHARQCAAASRAHGCRVSPPDSTAAAGSTMVRTRNVRPDTLAPGRRVAVRCVVRQLGAWIAASSHAPAAPLLRHALPARCAGCRARGSTRRCRERRFTQRPGGAPLAAPSAAERHPTRLCGVLDLSANTRASKRKPLEHCSGARAVIRRLRVKTAPVAFRLLLHSGAAGNASADVVEAQLVVVNAAYFGTARVHDGVPEAAQTPASALPGDDTLRHDAASNQPRRRRRVSHATAARVVRRLQPESGLSFSTAPWLPAAVSVRRGAHAASEHARARGATPPRTRSSTAAASTQGPPRSACNTKKVSSRESASACCAARAAASDKRARQPATLTTHQRRGRHRLIRVHCGGSLGCCHLRQSSAGGRARRGSDLRRRGQQHRQRATGVDSARSCGGQGVGPRLALASWAWAPPAARASASLARRQVPGRQLAAARDKAHSMQARWLELHSLGERSGARRRRRGQHVSACLGTT